jgi:DNA-binding MarR family transcriptional regulator
MRCLCATTRRAGRLLTRKYEEALRPSGLSVSQFELMAMLSRPERTDQSGLAALMEMDQTTLSRNLKVLLGQGWVDAAPDESDGRRRCYTVSKTGARVLAEAKQCWEGVHGAMQARLGGEMGELLPVLERIMDAARA